jgi:predicted phosphoribosyltransferase
LSRLKGYRDRRQAGEALAELLLPYRGKETLVLAVPRGGVPVALPVVAALGCVLDLIIPRKIGAPSQPELAIGAVCEDGEVLLNRRLVQSLGVSEEYISSAAAAEVAEIRRRLESYRGSRPAAALHSRTVIVIDDGVATGFTLQAALKSVARQNPRELVLAVPVGPPDSLALLARDADAVICPLQPEPFWSVGQFYRSFEQLDDEEVRSMLQQAWKEDIQTF